MKKSKSWIHVCVHFLLFITLGVHSDTLDFNPVTDDISKLSVLRQNIPKDYKIPVEYIPQQEVEMCWVKLNVYYLEQSLDGLANKFGNISSNRNDIRIVIDMLKGLRQRMGNLDPIMLEFQCHYRKERWETERYFDFVQGFFTAAQNKEYSDDCDPHPCPTTPYTVTTEEYSEGSPTPSSKDQECSTDCQASYKQPITLPKVVEQSLLSLLFIPLLALIFLLVWKVRSRRSEEDPQRNPGERVLFTGTQGTAPPIDAETSEKTSSFSPYQHTPQHEVCLFLDVSASVIGKKPFVPSKHAGHNRDSVKSHPLMYFSVIRALLISPVVSKGEKETSS